MDFFENNYSKSWKFMLECRWFFVFAFGLFCVTFLIGFIYPVFFRTEILEMIKTLMLEFEGKSMLALIVAIFLNNVMASFFAMFFGIFFGILPLITCVFNGYLLGFVARESVMVEGIGVMWKIFPHGIFELPAVIFSIGMGMRLGIEMFWGLGFEFENEKDRNIKRKGIRYVLVEGLRVFCFVVLPMLVVAGIIEGVLIGVLS